MGFNNPICYVVAWEVHSLLLARSLGDGCASGSHALREACKCGLMLVPNTVRCVLYWALWLPVVGGIKVFIVSFLCASTVAKRA